MGICTYQVAIKERVRGRENLHVYGYQIYALSFSQIQEANFLSPNTQIQWRRAKDPQANKILKEKEKQRGGSQKAHRFFTRLFFFLIIFLFFVILKNIIHLLAANRIKRQVDAVF